MARYPTFDEYDKRGNYNDGLKRCDELLAKNKNDVQLLTTKLQLLFATSNGDADALLDEMVGLQPPVHDLGEISAIEQAVVESHNHRTTFPRPLTAGPAVVKLWDSALKSATTTSGKLDMISVRFDRAISDNRLVDAQQTLIQLKAMQPKNRVVYMAHAALTQMLSKSNEDLSARLALSLARKAVTEKFDDNKRLDCRVPGQIFAIQRSLKDLEGIKGRPFQESKHVYDALRQEGTSGMNGVEAQVEVLEPETVPTSEWLYAELSSLKQKFRSLIEQQASAETISAFATSAVRLFLASITSLSAGARRSPADACFISISALVRLWEQTSNTRHLLQAAYIADMLLKYDPHIHEARLILVYLYMRLGLGSLAMRFFHSLSVKEVQHDTVGHTLFTRLSITLPQATALSKRESFDPSKRLLQALSVYVRCEDKLAETEASVLSHGQTGMIFDLQELRDNLRDSVSRRITLLEQRRVARLTKNAVGDTDAAKVMGPPVVANWVQTKDNRDFDAAFHYGFNVERALHGYGGKVPGQAWLLMNLAADSAWCLATGNAPLVDDIQNILQELDKVFTASDEPHQEQMSSSAALGMTAPEYLAGDVAYHLLKLLVAARSTEDQGNAGKGPETATSAVTSAVYRLNVETLVASSDPLTEHLVDHYLYADILRTVIAASSYARRHMVERQDELQQLQDLAKRLFLSLQKHATEQQSRIKFANVRAYMSAQDGVNGQMYQALREFGEASIETFCDDVARSAKGGWEGVSKIPLV